MKEKQCLKHGSSSVFKLRQQKLEEKRKFVSCLSAVTEIEETLHGMYYTVHQLVYIEIIVKPQTSPLPVVNIFKYIFVVSHMRITNMTVHATVDDKHRACLICTSEIFSSGKKHLAGGFRVFSSATASVLILRPCHVNFK